MGRRARSGGDPDHDLGTVGFARRYVLQPVLRGRLAGAAERRKRSLRRPGRLRWNRPRSGWVRRLGDERRAVGRHLALVGTGYRRVLPLLRTSRSGIPEVHRRGAAATTASASLRRMPTVRAAPASTASAAAAGPPPAAAVASRAVGEMPRPEGRRALFASRRATHPKPALPCRTCPPRPYPARVAGPGGRPRPTRRSSARARREDQPDARPPLSPES